MHVSAEVFSHPCGNNIQFPFVYAIYIPRRKNVSLPARVGTHLILRHDSASFCALNMDALGIDKRELEMLETETQEVV